MSASDEDEYVERITRGLMPDIEGPVVLGKLNRKWYCGRYVECAREPACPL